MPIHPDHLGRNWWNVRYNLESNCHKASDPDESKYEMHKTFLLAVPTFL